MMLAVLRGREAEARALIEWLAIGEQRDLVDVLALTEDVSRLAPATSTREDLSSIAWWRKNGVDMAGHTDAGSFGNLDPAIQKLEFKVTVLAAEEPKVQAELRRTGVSPARRKVYFYDTPELALFAKDLVLRARVTDGDDDDSTVKLRPLPVPNIPARWVATDAVRIELDVVGKKQVPSGKLDGAPDRGEIERVEHKALELSKLFTKAQEALVADELPSSTSLNDLAVLGPVDARKWDLPPETFPHKLSVEEWSLPDGTHFIELSFKVAPDEAVAAEVAFHALLDRLEIGHNGDPNPKTPRVLEILAERLRSARRAAVD
jgi:hypothetical protein